MEVVALTFAAAMLYSQHDREYKTMDTKCIIETVQCNIIYIQRFSHNTRFIIIITVESRDYAPPFVHVSIGQKWGGGLYAGS